MTTSSDLNTEKKIKIGPKEKIAFVCSGGATKAGAFHLGVALALQENGFRFYGGTKELAKEKTNQSDVQAMNISTYVGSSAGAILCSYLASGYSLESIFSSFISGANKNLFKNPLKFASQKKLKKITYQKMFKIHGFDLPSVTNSFFKIFSGRIEAINHFRLPKLNGIFSTSGIESYMREEVLPSNKFKDYLADLFIVATQLNHSKKTIFCKYSNRPSLAAPDDEYENKVTVSDACAASTALPGIFAPYGIQKGSDQIIHYIDGEVRDTLSSHIATDNGADLVLASYTHQPYNARDSRLDDLTHHGLSAIMTQSLYHLVEQKIKNCMHVSEMQKKAILSIKHYCKNSNISQKDWKQILALLQKNLQCKLNVDTIYIHPDPSDKQLFLANHFSLSSKKMAAIVKSGFNATVKTLKKYEFTDRIKKKTLI